MRNFGAGIAGILGLAVLVGCASSEITQRQSYAAQERMPRPGRIIVYDISATASDVPATAAITGSYGQRQSLLGLIVRGAIGVKDEKKGGSETLEGAAKRTAGEVAKELKAIFRRQGWI